jgi:hypothetical protein
MLYLCQSQQPTLSNVGAIEIMRKLLLQEDYVEITPHISNSDAGSLLDFILSLLRNELYSNGELKINRRARRLLLKVASKTHIIPKSLFIKGVTMKANLIGRGGFGYVFKGELGGALVALKYLHKNAPHNYRVSRQ